MYLWTGVFHVAWLGIFMPLAADVVLNLVWNCRSLHSLISSSQPHRVLVLVSTIVALLLYSSSVCACPCKCSQSRLSLLLKPINLCLCGCQSEDILLPFLAFSSAHRKMWWKVTVLVQFPLDGMVCYFRICTCQQSFTYWLVVLIAILKVQSVFSCIPSSNSYGRDIYCLDEVFPDKLSTRA